MNTIKRTLTIAVVAIVAICSANSASAQLKFGLKAGIDINSLKFDNLKDNFSSENRAGFVGGAMVEFTVPAIGVGVDASVLYVHRSSKTSVSDLYEEITGDKSSLSRDYIDIPINLKYKINIPVVSAFVKPFITTGPSFAFLASKKEITSALKNKSYDIAWNFGFGVELLSHVQVAASYGLGLTNTLEAVGATSNTSKIEGKNRYWTVTAAYLF